MSNKILNKKAKVKAKTANSTKKVSEYNNPRQVKDILPNKPSELIRVAIADLKAVEKMKKYQVNMETWHEKYESDDERCEVKNNKCQVCFAGSVIANKFNVNPDKFYDPESFSNSISNKLHALNLFREGDVYSALSEMGIKIKMDVAGTKIERDFDDLSEQSLKDLFGSVFVTIFNNDITEYDSDPEEFKNEMENLAFKLEAVGL